MQYEEQSCIHGLSRPDDFSMPTCRSMALNSLSGTVPDCLGSLQKLNELYVVIAVVAMAVCGRIAHSYSS